MGSCESHDVVVFRLLCRRSNDTLVLDAEACGRNNAELLKYGVSTSNLDRDSRRKERVPVQEKRAANARKKLAEHKAKLKREGKLVKKWEKKVRYYDAALSRKKASLTDPRRLSRLLR